MRSTTQGILGMTAVLVLVAGIGYSTIRSGPPAPVACTAEAKQCPDGTYVGRTGPKCEFTPCPIPNTSPGASAALGERARIGSIAITPLEVLQDSRCPVDAQCIQAGTVRISAKLESGSDSRTVALQLGAPFSFAGAHVLLLDVVPVRAVGKTLSPSDYHFIFTVNE